MTKHSTATGALDAFWDVLRRQTDRDPAFAAELVKALSVPIEIRVDSSTEIGGVLPLVDPVVIAGKGLDEFRRTFGAFKDTDLKKIIRHYNLAAPEQLTGRGAPRGGALLDLLWRGASSQRERLEKGKPSA